jgi:hypothetical protein
MQNFLKNLNLDDIGLSHVGLLLINFILGKTLKQLQVISDRLYNF